MAEYSLFFYPSTGARKRALSQPMVAAKDVDCCDRYFVARAHGLVMTITTEQQIPVLFSKIDDHSISWGGLVQLDWTPSARTQHMNPKKTGRATTNQRPRTESSWQGEFRSTWTIFVWSSFTFFFQNNFQITSKKKSSSRIGIASSNTCLRRSQVLLRCVCV